VVLGFTENAIDVLTRARLLAPSRHPEPAVARAIALRNRAFALLAQRNGAGAAADFERAVEILARLVEKEGQSDLGGQLAKALTPLAWLHATSPDASLRDAGKARAYATRACELS